MSEVVLADVLVFSKVLFTPSLGPPFGVLVKGGSSSGSDGVEQDSGSDLDASELSSSESSSSSVTGQSSNID